MKNLIRSISGACIVCTCLFMGSCNTSAPAPNSPKTDTVIIEQMKFTPQEITVNKGDTVVFMNRDIVAHDATEVKKMWNSPTLNMGDSWHFVPETSSDYYCSIHLVMKGKIIVR